MSVLFENSGTIASYGYPRNDIQYNACKNTELAVWIIAKSMSNGLIPGEKSTESTNITLKKIRYHKTSQESK